MPSRRELLSTTAVPAAQKGVADILQVDGPHTGLAVARPPAGWFDCGLLALATATVAGSSDP